MGYRTEITQIKTRNTHEIDWHKIETNITNKKNAYSFSHNSH